MSNINSNLSARKIYNAQLPIQYLLREEVEVRFHLTSVNISVMRKALVEVHADHKQSIL